MRCQFIKSEGKPCRAFAQSDNSYCFRHDPDTKETQLLASRKGGQNRVLQGSWGESVSLTSSEDLKNFGSGIDNGMVI